jgi:hypothetical protein
MHYYYRLAVMQQLLYPEERETSSPVLAATLVRNARADKETVQRRPCISFTYFC